MPLDQALPGQLRREEAARLEALVRLYYPDILRYAACRLKDRTQAEDVTQECFIRASRYLGEHLSQAKFRALLYKIAANLCVDAARKARPEPLADDVPHAEGGFAAVEAQDGFMRMLSPLPPEQRELILLRYGQDLKLREVADVLGLPLRTAQSRLRAALNTLKTGFEEKGEWR